MVDPETLRLNFFLLIGGLILLGFLFFFAVAVVTLIRTWLFIRKRRKAEEKWVKASRRADGRTYPIKGAGMCDFCHRGSNHIYCEYAKNLCPACYEKYWRQVENWTGPDKDAEMIAKSRRLI